MKDFYFVNFKKRFKLSCDLFDVRTNDLNLKREFGEGFPTILKKLKIVQNESVAEIK